MEPGNQENQTPADGGDVGVMLILSAQTLLVEASISWGVCIWKGSGGCQLAASRHWRSTAALEDMEEVGCAAPGAGGRSAHQSESAIYRVPETGLCR
jgi:hypothetical protein